MSANSWVQSSASKKETVFQIPIDQDQRIFQFVVHLMISIAYLLFMLFWIQRNRAETKLHKMMNTMLYVGRILGHFVTAAGTITVFAIEDLYGNRDAQGKDAISTCNTIVTICYYVFGKTIPNCSVVLILMESMCVFLSPLRLTLVLRITSVIVLSLVLLQTGLSFIDPIAIIILDYTSQGATFVCTVIQCIILWKKISGMRTLLFQEEYKHHIRTMYTGVMYNIGIFVMLLCNTIQMAFDFEEQALVYQWFYWILQNSYVVISTILIIFATFPPAWLLSNLIHRADDLEVPDNNIHEDFAESNPEDASQRNALE